VYTPVGDRRVGPVHSHYLLLPIEQRCRQPFESHFTAHVMYPSVLCIFFGCLLLLSSLGQFLCIVGPIRTHNKYHTNHHIMHSSEETYSRRRILLHPVFSSLVFSSTLSQPAYADVYTPTTVSPLSPEAFYTAAFGKQEYTNSIIVSRDTNISPAEVYDSISSSLLQYPLQQAQQQKRIPKAWDVGCGAGVSTQVLWNMGYQDIIAIDWSSTAWETFVVEQGSCPSSVSFYNMDDETFVSTTWPKQQPLFDVIVFNFAINESKAQKYAQQLLYPNSGRLLAPVNVQSDYWLKQVYRVYDSQGKLLWDAQDVGAWSVLFQPDVTQDTCQGIWCSPYNGFQKKKR
jgi:hypothetical protein